MKLVPLVAAIAALVLPATAAAREAYVVNYDADAVSVIDTATNQVVGGPISTGLDAGPYMLAIAPDGRFVYVSNYDEGALAVIDTATKSVQASIPVGNNPYGVAISPDGSRAYVAAENPGRVVVIDLRTRQVVGAPVLVSGDAFGIALTPDGSRLFVGEGTNDSVAVIDTGSLQLIGLPIPVGEDPYWMAITPDGGRLFVGNAGDDNLTVIDARALAPIGAPIPVGNRPLGVAIAPDGRRAYVANHEDNSVSVVDTGANAVSATIPGVAKPEFVALTPDGSKGFTNLYPSDQIAVFAPATNQPAGPGIKTDGPTQLAVVPDQSPTASFRLRGRARPGVPVAFDASGSSDTDGTVALYTWAFPTGASGMSGPRTRHPFAKPGKYKVTLTVTDNEGCSVATVFTGQTAYCNGNPAGSITKTVTVAYPGVKAKCPKWATLGCKVTMQAVKWQGKGKKRRLVPQSAVAKAKLKAGGAKTLALKPKKNVRNKLAKAKKILVLEKATAARKGSVAERVRVVKLRVVG